MILTSTISEFIMQIDSTEESKKISDELILYHKNSNEKREGSTYGGVVDKTRKHSIDVILEKNAEEYEKFVRYLQICVKEYLKIFPHAGYTDKWGLIDNVNIQHYPVKGGFFSWHTERMGCKFPSVTRHLVFMMYLNDVTDGGETEFLHQKLKVDARKGKVVIWPVDWTHVHRGITSDTQEKYIATGWFNFY